MKEKKGKKESKKVAYLKPLLTKHKKLKDMTARTFQTGPKKHKILGPRGKRQYFIPIPSLFARKRRRGILFSPSGHRSA